GHEAEELGSSREEEREHVERAHDHEREAGLAVGDLQELVPFVEGVHEGAVALASVEGALGVLGELSLLLALLLRRGVGQRAGRSVLRRHARGCPLGAHVHWRLSFDGARKSSPQYKRSSRETSRGTSPATSVRNREFRCRSSKPRPALAGGPRPS